MKNRFVLIGIDGGATKVNARQVLFDESSNSFAISDIYSEKSYIDIPGFLSDFQPVNIQDQLNQIKNGKISPTLDEVHQGAVFVEASAKAVLEICEQSEHQGVMIGIGLPGLKTMDKRGVAVMANGPRIPDFSILLEERLALESVNLIKPIAYLGSDADYCGIGENFAANGNLKNLKNAYYLGSGTGVADALKLNGKLIPFDEIKPWMAKTWEMQWIDGISLEKYVSAKGILQNYSESSGKPIEQLIEEEIHLGSIVKFADRSEKAAIYTLEKFCKILAALLFERIETLFAGWQGNFTFPNPDRKITELNHPYCKLVFDGIVLGQRLGQVLSTEAGAKILGAPLIKNLSENIEKSGRLSDQAKNHYSDLSKIFKYSTLRDAPALGAGIDAYITFKGPR